MFLPSRIKLIVSRMQNHVGTNNFLYVHRHASVVLTDVVVHHADNGPDASYNGAVVRIGVHYRCHQLVASAAALLNKVDNLRRGQVLQRRVVATDHRRRRSDHIEIRYGIAGHNGRTGPTSARYRGRDGIAQGRTVAAATGGSCEIRESTF